MNHSRRRFLRNSALTATAVPFALTAGVDYCEAATESKVDLSMGFPDDAIRLCWNENTLGPSSKAIEAAKEAVSLSHRYALGDELTPHLAEYLGIDKDWILMGTGSSEILRLAPIAYARHGGNVVGALETWGGLLAVAKNLEVDVRRIPLKQDEGYAYDIDGMLDAVDSETRLFVLVTPNNPTGGVLSYDEIKHIADSLPKDVLFVLDQAYIDYQDDRRSGAELIKQGYNNVLVTHTFSKSFALAGLRVGYGMAHPDILKTIRQFGSGPGSISIVAFAAVLASLGDPGHAARSREYVRETRQYYENELSDLGLNYVSGPAPFILIELGDQSKAVFDELERRHIFITHGNSWHLPNHIRVSYGTEDENQAFFSAFKEIL
jgi:histidinol-phosphate aminotransferase